MGINANENEKEPQNIIEMKGNFHQSNKISELDAGSCRVSMNIANKVLNSICKIIITKKNNEKNYGTGFFMIAIDSGKYLITNYHIISENVLDEDIEIEINNNKKMKLLFTNRDIIYFPKPIDITLVEIKKSDEIFKDIQFLKYDKNYIDGYHIYKEANIFTIGYPHGDEASLGSGKIIKIDEYELYYNISSSPGTSGSPIILLTSNINLIQVIGIHKEADYSENLNCGTFIGEIFKKNNSSESNYIIAEINIDDDNINDDIRILNSYEEFIRNSDSGKKLNKEEMNEKEIKKCCIKINNESIAFNYFHRFSEIGNYIIRYSFKKNITKTNYMFFNCNYLKHINLSNFKTQEIINMNNMFSFCESLEDIDLSNLNTQNVTNMSNMFFACHSLLSLNLSNLENKNVLNMSNMFRQCESLKDLNLSNFHTENVKNMYGMFSWCKSLKKLDIFSFKTDNVINMSYMFFQCKLLNEIKLSNFKTPNVDNMNCMFSWCESLEIINLSNFDTSKVQNMAKMFSECNSLINLDLSHINTENVKDMAYMFSGCESLQKIDLSDFNTQNVTNMSNMFSGCESLVNLDLSKLDTQNVVNMNNMFSYCKALKNINLSGFDTKNVINMSNMFSYCSSLEDINLSNFSTQNVINISSMFSMCTSLKNLNIKNLSIQNVRNISHIFSGCILLKEENIISDHVKIFQEYFN